MIDPSIKLGGGDWAVKENKLLGYRPLVTKFEPIEFDITRNTIATEVDKDGIIRVVQPNVARIDYSEDGEGKLLVEPQRTNINTNYLIQDWSGQHQKTINFGISPEGVQNSTELVNLGTFNTGTSKAYSVQNGVTYTLSLYLKLNYGVLENTGNVYIYPNSNGANISFSDLTSEWQRYSVTYVSAMTGNQTIQIRTDVPSSIEVYGVQLEEGNYATSIIPTNGIAVTRLRDVISKTGISNYINSEEGILYVEMATLGIDSYLSLTGADVSTYCSIIYSASLNRIIYQYRTTGYSVQSELLLNLPNEVEFIKVACKWKLNDFALWVNGTKVGTDLLGNVSSAGSFSILKLSTSGGGDLFYGKLKALQVFPTTLTDLELQTLTTQ